MDLSVIICTHNPRPELLHEVVEHLRVQTADPSRHAWDVIVIDNSSTPPLALDVGLPVPFRVVRETTPGLTAARCRGAQESTAPLLLYVDDDNLLDAQYVENALSLAARHPDVGVFSAAIRPRFESPPPARYRPFLRFLALTRFEEDEISSKAPSRCMPVGAGMMVRRSVMAGYETALQSSSIRSLMDRAPGTLLAGGDTDIGYAAVSQGLACGRFTGLRLTHVIPRERVEPPYLRRIVRDVSTSHELLRLLHGSQQTTPALERRYRSRVAALWPLRWRPLWHLRYEQYRGRLAALALFQKPASVASAFDVFDTCLVRVFASPKALFLQWAEAALREGMEGTPTAAEIRRLAEARVEAERLGRQISKDEDTRLDQVYTQLQRLIELPLSPDRMKALELDLEEDALRPAPEVRALIDAHRKQGKRILFISDMYLPVEFVKQQLVRHAIAEAADPVYVSSATGLRKGTGNLYRHVLQQERLDPAAVTMHGDHPGADVRASTQLGMHASLLPDSHLTRYEYPADARELPQSWQRSCAAGLARIARLRLPPPPASCTHLSVVMADAIAPMLTAYLIWVLQDARERGLDRLYFVARDGDLLMRTAQALGSRLEIPECRYLYGSRKAWLLPGSPSADRAGLDWLIGPNQSQSLYALLDKLDVRIEEMDGLARECGLPTDDPHRDLANREIDAFWKMLAMPACRERVQARIDEAREATLAYFRQEGALEPGAALVDVGWRGRSQAGMNRIRAAAGTATPMPGYYLAVLPGCPGDASEHGELRSFLRPGSWGAAQPLLLSSIHRNAPLIEQVFLMPRHGSTVGYDVKDGRAEPRLSRFDDTRERDAFLSRLDETIACYAKEAAPFAGDAGFLEGLVEYAAQAVHCFVHTPTRDEAKELRWLHASNDPGEIRMTALVQPVRGRLLFHLAWNKMLGRKAPPEFGQMWRAGSFAISPWYARILFMALTRLQTTTPPSAQG